MLRFRRCAELPVPCRAALLLSTAPRPPPGPHAPRTDLPPSRQRCPGPLRGWPTRGSVGLPRGFCTRGCSDGWEEGARGPCLQDASGPGPSRCRQDRAPAAHCAGRWAEAGAWVVLAASPAHEVTAMRACHPHARRPAWAGAEGAPECLLTDSLTAQCLPRSPVDEGTGRCYGIGRGTWHTRTARQGVPSPIPGSGALCSKGLPPPEGHAGPSWAGGRGQQLPQL